MYGEKSASGNYEDGLKVKIDEKLYNLPKFKNVYKNGKNNKSPNAGTKKKNASKLYVLQRVKTKLLAVKHLKQVPKMDSNDNDGSRMQPVSMDYIIDNLMVVTKIHSVATVTLDVTYKLIYNCNLFHQLHHSIMGLGDFINRITRFQVLLIFLQSALSIVFNTYNLVMYLMRLAFGVKVSLGPGLALMFYAHLITCAAVDIFLTIFGFAMLHASVEKTVRILNTLMLYVTDEGLAVKLSRFTTRIKTNIKKYSVFGLYTLDGSCISAILSGTVTYIIILVQYSDMPTFSNFRNSTRD